MSLGLAEMVVIAAIALVVIGPEKFPDFAKIVIRAFRDVRGYMDEAKQELAKELRPVQKEINSIGKFDAKPYINSLTQPTPPKPAAAPPPPSESPEVTTHDPVDAQNVVFTEEVAEVGPKDPVFEHVEAPVNLDNPEVAKRTSGMDTYNTD